MNRILPVSSLLVFVVCIKLITYSVMAGNHYCPTGHSELSIDVSVRAYQDERIIAEVDEPSEGEEPPSDCRWVVKASYLTFDRQLLLEGVPRDSAAKTVNQSDSSVIRYRLQAPDDAQCLDGYRSREEFVYPGLFKVIPMSTDGQTYLSVTCQPQPQSPVILRAVMPQVGFCSRDMLSFMGNCYAINHAKTNATEAVSNIRGDAQLASFRSMSEINEFVAANDARLHSHPYKRPLNLTTEPILLAMFYNNTNDTIVSVVRDGSHCRVKHFENGGSTLIKQSATVCLSLKVNKSRKAVLELVSCNQPLFSLISFPETPSASGCRNNCTDISLLLISTLETQGRRKTSETDQVSSNSGSQRNDMNSIFKYLLAVPLVLFLILLFAINVRFSEKKRKLTDTKVQESFFKGGTAKLIP